MRSYCFKKFLLENLRITKPFALLVSHFEDLKIRLRPLGGLENIYTGLKMFAETTYKESLHER